MFFFIDSELNCLQKKQMDFRGTGPPHYLSIAVEHLITGILQLSGSAGSGWGVRFIPHHLQQQASRQTAGKVTTAQGYVGPTILAVLLPKVRQIYKMTSKQNWWKEETNISSLKLDFYNVFVSIWQLTYANFFLVQPSLVQIN